MKIITTATNWDITKLYDFLQRKLNPLFRQTRQTDITFNIVLDGDTIEINQPEMYESFLFRLTIEGNKLYINKSEHYVDDVNQLTLQSLLETLEMDSRDGQDIVYISGE